MGMRITCAVCEKPVDRIAWTDDLPAYKRRIAVFCHGERDDMMISLGSGSLASIADAEGVAFEARRLALSTRKECEE